MPKSLKQRGIAPDISLVLAMVEEGKTYAEIARFYGVGRTTVNDWLRAPEVREQSARALSSSAEAWLDRGLEELEKSSNEGAARARYIAHECARRAGIRNMHYRERMGIDAKHSGEIKIEIVKFGDDTDTEPVDS